MSVMCRRMDYIQSDNVIDNGGSDTLQENEEIIMARKWLNWCTLGVATVNASTSTWVLIIVAAMALHPSKYESERPRQHLLCYNSEHYSIKNTVH